MGPRGLAIVLAGMLAVYLILLGRTGLLLLASGDPLGMALGLVILVFPVGGAWVIWRELRFGFTAQKMAQEIVEPTDGEDFESCKARAEARPNDWQAWYQVAAAYEDAGDRRGARKSMYHAAALYRQG